MMDAGDPIETAIAIAGLLAMVVSLAVALVRWAWSRRRARAARQDVLMALAATFDLGWSGEGLEGQIDGRHVKIGFRTESWLVLRAELRRPIVAPSIKVVEFEDGPYQKSEELHGGGAHRTGDREFDRRFLVYGPREQSVSPELRRLLIERPLVNASLTRRELSCSLALDAARAIAITRAALALCDQIEALPTAD